MNLSRARRSFWSGIALSSLLAVAVSVCVPASRLTASPADTSGVPIADARASQSHVFHFEPSPGQEVQHANLAGDFNGWSTSATPMEKVGDAYEVKLTLSEGIHYYKFVIDGHWLNDPRSNPELQVSDDNGGNNSGVLIGLDARTLPQPAPDKIDPAAITFDPADVRDFNIASTSLLRLSIRAQSKDVSQASVLIQPTDTKSNGKDATGDKWTEFPLSTCDSSMGFDRFGGIIDSAVKPGAGFKYVLKLSKPNATVYVAASQAFSDSAAAEAVAYQAVMTPAFDTPDWAKHAVWYQIFPERFRNGDSSNDPDNTQKWTSKWFAQHPGETGDFYGADVWARRYGGDIQGIRQELPYLRSLGINAIYLNPIFQAWDLHKYDTTDYRHVDEHFGVKGDIEQLQGETEDPATWQWTASDKVFLDFVAEAHRQGFKVIVDGVFNHVGTRFWAFQDVIKNGRNSKYASWFDITDWTPSEHAPFHYHAWDKDNGALPAFKKDPVLGIVHGPREHIMAITRRWLAPDGDPSRGVDGFRLDAPEGIAHPFWAEYRQMVKSVKPQAYITGEIWPWAQSYLQGDQYDAVMNYQFAMASQEFFVNQKTAIHPSELNSKAYQLIFNYPFQIALVNQNLFDSHDTDRVASMFVNPDLPYDGADRIQDNGPHYNPAKPNAQQRQRMLQEVAWQMTFVGAPMIYYGDETGMWSPDDPSDREPMTWKDLEPYDDPQVRFDQDKFDWYQRLIAVRAQLPALQTGFYHPVLIDNARDLFVFSRDLGHQHVYVVLNRSNRTQDVQFEPAEQNQQYVNWLDPLEASVQQNGENRPSVSIKQDAAFLKLDGHAVKFPIKAWQAAVLSAVQ